MLRTLALYREVEIFKNLLDAYDKSINGILHISFRWNVGLQNCKIIKYIIEVL